MDADENFDQNSNKTEISPSPGSDYRTPLQTPSSEANTPVPRRFADFTFSSTSDDSSLSNTPLDSRLVKELLGSDSSGKSIHESFNSSYSSLMGTEKGSGTESTLALSPDKISISGKKSLAESYVSDADRSKDELNEAQLFDISTEKTLDLAKDVHNFHHVDSVQDKVCHRRDDIESNASSCSTSKEMGNLKTERKNSVSMKIKPFGEPTGLFGSFKELSETLPPHVELTKRNKFEAYIDTNKSFFNEAVVEKTFFRDLDGPGCKQESPSDEVHPNRSGKCIEMSPTESLSTEVKIDMLSSPKKKCSKEDVSRIGEFKKVLKVFFRFSKGKDSDEKKLDESQSVRVKNTDTQKVVGCSSEQPFIAYPNFSLDASPSLMFEGRDHIPKIFSPSIPDENANKQETESSEENTLISNNGMKRKNDALDSPKPGKLHKLDAELAMNFDRDLILLESDTNSEVKESDTCEEEPDGEQNKSPAKAHSKTTLSQNVSPSNIFSLSFNADELRMEQKLKEEHEMKLLRDVQELKSKRIQNTFANKESSYAKILAEIKAEPVLDGTCEPELQESIYNLISGNEEKQLGLESMNFKESKNSLSLKDVNVLHDQESSFELRPLDASRRKEFLFSEPINICMENVMNLLCSREEEEMESTSLDHQIKSDSPMAEREKADRPSIEDLYSKHTCEEFFNLSPIKVTSVRSKKNSMENSEEYVRDIDATPVKLNKETTDIHFDKSIAKGVVKALKDIKSKNGLLLSQIQKFLVQKKLVRIGSKVNKEVERFMNTAEEIGIVTKKGSRFYPQIVSSRAPNTKRVDPKLDPTVVQKKSSSKVKKVSVKVATPSSRRLEKYRQKAMNSPIPLVSLRTKRASESAKELKETMIKSLRSRDIMVRVKSIHKV